MPRELKCTCGNCKVCAHRDYMRRYRDVVFPTDESWAKGVEREAAYLSRYVCPLSTISAAMMCIDLRRARKSNLTKGAGE